jgi:hypothetical protein
MGRDFVRRSDLPRSAEVHGVSGDWPLHDQAWIDDTFRRVAGMLPDKLKKPSPSSPGLQSAPGSVLAIIHGKPIYARKRTPGPPTLAPSRERSQLPLQCPSSRSSHQTVWPLRKPFRMASDQTHRGAPGLLAPTSVEARHFDEVTGLQSMSSQRRRREQCSSVSRIVRAASGGKKKRLKTRVAAVEDMEASRNPHVLARRLSERH